MNEYELAVEAVKKAGDYLENYDVPKIDDLTGKDIKLSSDKKSEAIIIDLLQRTNIPIVSEESGLVGNKNEGLYWVVDPLDGSANYFKGIKELTCTSVALFDKGEPVLGAIYRFHTNELFSGEVGKGAWLNGQRINTSKVSNVGDAMLSTGFPVKRNYSEESLRGFIEQVQKFKKIRMLGTAALMGCFVASGRIDAYVEEEIMIWDVAASSAIVKAAGGYVNLELLDDYKCICELFATKALYDDYKNVRV